MLEGSGLDGVSAFLNVVGSSPGLLPFLRGPEKSRGEPDGQVGLWDSPLF